MNRRRTEPANGIVNAACIGPALDPRRRDWRNSPHERLTEPRALANIMLENAPERVGVCGAFQTRRQHPNAAIWSRPRTPRYRVSVLRELDSTHIVETTVALQKRIDERFEGSGLGKVAKELGDVAREAASVAEWLGRPIW